jgi:hypothetical protein
MTSLPEWSTDPECLLLARLREAPELLTEAAASELPEMALQTELRRRYPDDLVRAALSLVALRKRAECKFSRAAEMWFDRQGLEQSTSEPVARHKAQRFSGRVWDLCCGIGGDALALAERCEEVTAVDQSPAATLRTVWNAEVYGVAENVRPVCATVEKVSGTLGSVPDTGAGQLVHIDPDRRPGTGGRAVRLEDYAPSLAFLRDLQRAARGGAIKLGPASNFGGKFPGCEIELISLHGECKEATVWFGELAGPAPFRATVLPSGETIAGHPLEAAAPVTPLDRYVFDPDPAVVRAGLVDLLATQLGLDRLDPAEEYLTGPEPVSSPFVQAFAVEADLPNNERHLRDVLRKSSFGALEIKCRHVPIDAEALRRRLPRPGREPGVLLFARVEGRTRAILARRVP